MGWRCSNSVQPSRRPLRVGLPVALAGRQTTPTFRWTRAGGGDACLHHWQRLCQPDRSGTACGANYELLVAVKNKYDPTNLFRYNQKHQADIVE